LTISELGSLGELVGALATVATLLYLAFQIRANTLATKRQALDDTIDRVIGWARHVAASPEQLSCWIKGSEGFEKLSVEDQLRFTALNMEIFGAAEASLEAAKFGGVKPETVVAVTGIIAQLSLNNGAWEWWEINGKHVFAEDFAQRVNEIGEDSRASDQHLPVIRPFQLPDAGDRP
jgi:hypothetical protein